MVNILEMVFYQIYALSFQLKLPYVSKKAVLNERFARDDLNISPRPIRTENSTSRPIISQNSDSPKCTRLPYINLPSSNLSHRKPDSLKPLHIPHAALLLFAEDYYARRKKEKLHRHLKDPSKTLKDLRTLKELRRLVLEYGSVRAALNYSLVSSYFRCTFYIGHLT